MDADYQEDEDNADKNERKHHHKKIEVKRKAGFNSKQRLQSNLAKQESKLQPPAKRNGRVKLHAEALGV